MITVWLRISWLAAVLWLLLALVSPPPGKATKYLYDGQFKTEGVSGRINRISEFVYDGDGKWLERIFSGGLLIPQLVDSTLTVNIHAEVQRVYFLWGDGQGDSWVNQHQGEKAAHTFIHSYSWNGDFLCQIYFIARRGVTRHYTAEITISGL